jgi:predicted CopG family antitoxin
MGHKTLTISEDAYAVLAGLKARGESFTDVILRLTAKTRKGTLLDYVRTMKPDEEFAKSLEEIVKRRERAHIRNVPGRVDWHSIN